MTAAPPRGAFVLSFDFELAWGEFYRRPVDNRRMLEARRVLPRLLALLERHRVPATFAVTGHLLLEGCDGHPELPPVEVRWRPGDWMAGDPHGDETRHPAWYAPSLVRAIAAAAPGHDIGGHGFSHLPLDEPGVGPGRARAEIAGCARLLAEGGHAGLSFVFPRNGLSYLELLREQGFRCYRAAESRWHRQAPSPLRKVAHMLEQTLALPPSVGLPVESQGLTATAGSMLFLSREGFRRAIPMASRVARARRGLARAASERRVFHLWMHVEDLVPGSDAMLLALETVLGEACRRRERGEIDIHTMADLVGSGAGR